MKPLGPIPAGFDVMDGELSVGGLTSRELVERAGSTPVFVYSRDLIERRIADLRAAMPSSLAIHYAIKANSYGPLLEFVAGLVDGLDIASGGELQMAIDALADPQDVSFAGPGKRDAELEAAIRAAITLNCESEGEAERTLAIGRRIGVTPRMAVRVNPDFELRGSGMKMGGGAKPFGVDQARVPQLVRYLVREGAQWRGLHIYTGSQSLDADAIIETQGKVLELAASLSEEAGMVLPHLNLGGGFGIPYFHKDEPLDIAAIGEALKERFDNLPAPLADTQFAIELGRYLVGEAGIYFTRVVDRKESHGQTYLVTDGGLHHQLAASGNFGTVVRRNYPVAIANRFAEEAVEEANVVGCLCTPLDRLADQAWLPHAREGDLVAVFCAGAYGASASPSAFLGQGPAAELLI